MACLVLQPSSPSPCIYSQCLLRFSATRSRTAVLEFVGAINGQPTRILADTAASLSLLSSVFDDKSRVKTKNIKKGSVHGITGHSMSFSQEAVVRIGVDLSPLKVFVADIADFDLVISFSKKCRFKPSIDWRAFRMDTSLYPPGNLQFSSGGRSHWCHACRNPRTLAAIGWVCADR